MHDITSMAKSDMSAESNMSAERRQTEMIGIKGNIVMTETPLGIATAPPGTATARLEM
jgi:hypothetical protein